MPQACDIEIVFDSEGQFVNQKKEQLLFAAGSPMPGRRTLAPSDGPLDERLFENSSYLDLSFKFL